MKKMTMTRRDGTRTRTAKDRARAYRAARRVKYAPVAPEAATAREEARA